MRPVYRYRLMAHAHYLTYSYLKSFTCELNFIQKKFSIASGLARLLLIKPTQSIEIARNSSAWLMRTLKRKLTSLVVIIVELCYSLL